MGGWAIADGGGHGQRGPAWRRDRSRWYKSNARVLTVLTRGEGGVRARNAMGTAAVEPAGRAEKKLLPQHPRRWSATRNGEAAERAGAKRHDKVRLGVKLRS